jgi:hypothetical protein
VFLFLERLDMRMDDPRVLAAIKVATETRDRESLMCAKFALLKASGDIELALMTQHAIILGLLSVATELEKRIEALEVENQNLRNLI